MLLSKVSVLAFIFIGRLISAADPPSDPYTCSASRPCTLGCCSTGGVCGLGPNFCGAGNCTSSCDQKSDCDPGWGSAWSKSEKCPLNVCCSKFGFCGSTADFCGTSKVLKPSCGGTSVNGRIIGYYEGWSTTRACDQMVPESIPAGAYTHLNYAFAFIDPSSFAVAPMSDLDISLYPRLTSLKEANPGLQTWISIGGWSMNDPDQPTATTFSDLAGSTTAQTKFFASLISFMSTYGFDGVDIDWEYPGAPERSGKPADFANYVSLLTNLKAALGSGGHAYGLSITLPSSYWYLQNFDIVKIAKIVDWFNVMTYDLHGTWDSTDKFIGPIINAHTNLTEIDQTMDLFWRNNIDPKKISLGLGFYGRSFTLTDPSCTKAGCPFSSGGTPGACSASAGTLMYAEIQDIIAGGASPTLDKDAAVKQLVWDTNQWISYDDADTFKLKIDYANKICLGGLMVWAASTDDRNWTAAESLMTGIGGALQKKSLWGGGKPKTEVSSCEWGACAKKPTCNSPLSAVSKGNGKGFALMYSGCKEGETRYYCCPANNPPKCQWRGTWAFCPDSACKGDEVAIASDNSGDGYGCWTGHKNLCCTQTVSDAQSGQCKWEGAAPFCSAIAFKQYGCDESDRKSLTYSNYGAGGESGCYLGYKSLCCTQPPPYTGCQWVTSGGFSLFAKQCATACPSGQQVIAVDPSGCVAGTAQYFCCDELTEEIPDASAIPPQFCISSPDGYVFNDELDGDGNPADYLELDWYEQTCFDIPNLADPAVHPAASRRRNAVIASVEVLSKARSWVSTGSPETNETHGSVCLSESECYSFSVLQNPKLLEWLLELYHGPHTEIVPRNRLVKLCLPNKQTVDLAIKTNKKVNALAALGRPFMAAPQAASLVKSGICYSLPLFDKYRQIGVKYVAEHFSEVKTPALFSKAVSTNKLLSGGTPLVGYPEYDWGKVFADKTGYFFKSWADLGIPKPPGIVGESIADAITNAMGTDSDFLNNLILDDPTNSIKKSMWSVFKNIVSDTKFEANTPQGQLEIVNRLFQTLPEYMARPEGLEGAQHVYDVTQLAWAALDSAPASIVDALPRGIKFAATHAQFTADHYLAMQANLQTHTSGRITEAIAYWSSATAEKKFVPAVCKALVFNLQGQLGQVAEKVVLTAPKA